MRYVIRRLKVKRKPAFIGEVILIEFVPQGRASVAIVLVDSAGNTNFCTTHTLKSLQVPATALQPSTLQSAVFDFNTFAKILIKFIVVKFIKLLAVVTLTAFLKKTLSFDATYDFTEMFRRI